MDGLFRRDCLLAVIDAFIKHWIRLAVGCNDYRIVFWNYITRGITKIVSDNDLPVSWLTADIFKFRG